MWPDVRYGVRMLLKSPGFAAVAVIALALGIGANTAIFSVIDAVLLRPLPFKDPARLVIVWETFTARNSIRNVVSPANFLDWQSQNTVFEEMAVFVNSRWIRLNLTGLGEPEELPGQAVSPNFFNLIGVTAATGRAILPEDRDRVVVLSQKLWERRFGSDPSWVGKAVTLSGNSFTVVGVMPQGFEFLDPAAEFWTPLILEQGRDYRKTSGRYLSAVGRLKPGVSVRQAQAEMNAIAQRLERDYVAFNKGWGVNVVPLKEQVSGEVQQGLYVLFGAVGFLLLIACANVANLLLARAAARQREIAIRAAIGAGRGRIVRQLLTESVLLSLVGGALGILLAVWGVRGLVALAPGTLPRVGEVGLDARVLAFTCLLSLATGVIFGLAPAWQSSLALRVAASTRPRNSASRYLVMAEVALSLVLLTGAGLLIRSFWQLMTQDTGFQSEKLLTARVPLPGSRYNRQQQVAFFERAIGGMRALPGVRAASATNMLPFAGLRSATGFRIQGQPEPAPGQGPVCDVRTAFPDFFRTMGIPLLKGRDFNERDTRDAPRVFVINQALGRKYWPNEDPIGKRISVAMGDNVYGEIVGVVGDIKDQTLEGELLPTVYYSYSHLPYAFATFVVRTSSDPAAAVSGLKQVIRSLDPSQPVADMRVMREVLSASAARQRFSTMLLAVFAAVALALVAVGIYGVMAYSVTQRTQEIGVRMAIGAQRVDMLRLVFRQGMTIALAGLAVGLGAALVLTRVLTTLLFRVKPTDPITYIAGTALLATVAAAAILAPALRATKVDPLVALRYE